jgi:hypothetical protein
VYVSTVVDSAFKVWKAYWKANPPTKIPVRIVFLNVCTVLQTKYVKLSIILFMFNFCIWYLCMNECGIYLCEYGYMNIYLSIIYMYIHIHVCIYICMYEYMNICVCLYIHIYIHIYKYMHIHMYIHLTFKISIHR